MPVTVWIVFAVVSAPIAIAEKQKILATMNAANSETQG
jgi:hypothetical protein